ncbi:hypothetical protein PQR53_05365 [Paraburkholderia fungorum]|uniref:hypothetical protein n=1 Tax=Paraburkholderia fungorum TaxID=134537 RepID=UPI0038B97568
MSRSLQFGDYSPPGSYSEPPIDDGIPDRESNPSHYMTIDSTTGRAQFGQARLVDSYAVVI